ncbi:sensor histidine kinase [Anaeromassilibacillus sp. SJQ-1]|uniref:sensor histidine kinase n=1 Tax=Anaeromassilibacillus sp. SJQ-1 TaxID=3375419 RepID=UPI00398A0DDB
MASWSATHPIRNTCGPSADWGISGRRRANEFFARGGLAPVFRISVGISGAVDRIRDILRDGLGPGGTGGASRPRPGVRIVPAGGGRPPGCHCPGAEAGAGDGAGRGPFAGGRLDGTDRGPLFSRGPGGGRPDPAHGRGGIAVVGAVAVGRFPALSDEAGPPFSARRRSRGAVHTRGFSQPVPARPDGGVFHLLASVDELAMALESKGEAERRAKEFLKDALSDISHQLKTPLAALHMYNEIVLEEPENAETVRQFSEKAAQALRRMEDLIGTLLKVMRLDAGSIPFEKELYSMGEVLLRATEELTTRAQREGKRIRWRACRRSRSCATWLGPAKPSATWSKMRWTIRRPGARSACRGSVRR